MSIRDDIRAATLGTASQFRRRAFTLPAGLQVEVQEPSVKARSDLMKLAKVEAARKGGVVSDVALMQAYAVIRLTYVAGANERVFGDADLEALLEQPCGGWFDDLSQIALSMINVREDESRPNSETTPSDSSSSV